MVAIVGTIALLWYQYTEDKTTSEIESVAITTKSAEVDHPSEPIADSPMENSSGLSFLQGGNEATLMNNVVNISFDLPEGWRIEGAEPQDHNSAYLITKTGRKAAKITCPIPAVGGPYEHSATTPLLERTFTKEGVLYEASFSELAANLFEDSVDEEGNRSSQYVGPGTKTSYVKSRVSPVDKAANPDMGCILYQHDPTEEEIVLLRTIYHSWR